MKRVSEHAWNIGQRFERESPADWSMVDVVLADDYDVAIRERDEARAELAKVKESAAWHERNAKFFSAALTHMTEDRDALRAAVEKHNARCHNDMNAGELMPETWPTEYLIPLPPTAAPAASESRDYVSISELVAEWEKDPAMAELIVSARKSLAPLLYRDGDPRRERMARGEGPAASEHWGPGGGSPDYVAPPARGAGIQQSTARNKTWGEPDDAGPGAGPRPA